MIFRILTICFTAGVLFSCEGDNPSSSQTIIAPGGLKATTISSRQIELTWEDNSDNESGFVVERSRGGLEDVQELAANSTRFRATMLLPNSFYRFRVRAFNAQTKSKYSDFAEATTLNNQGPWVESASGTAVDFRGVAVTEDNISIAVGERGVILRSEDGGEEWSQPFSRTENTLFDVMFMNSDTGAVAGGTFASGFSVVLQTFNAGFEWVFRDVTLQVDLNAVSLVGRDSIFAVGDQGTTLRSVDSGVQWSHISTPTTHDLFGVAFIDSRVGFAVGEQGTILKTSNGGNSWTIQGSGTDQSLFDICGIDASTMIVVGEGGVVLKSENSGNNWTAQSSGTLNDLHGVSFPSPTVGFAVGQSGTILQTTDGGVNWQQQQSGATNGLFDVHFMTPDIGFAVGEYGTILHTSTGGD